MENNNKSMKNDLSSNLNDSKTLIDPLNQGSCSNRNDSLNHLDSLNRNDFVARHEMNFSPNHQCNQKCEYVYNCPKFIEKDIFFHNVNIPYILRSNMIFDLSKSCLEDYISTKKLYEKSEWFSSHSYAKSLSTYIFDKTNDFELCNIFQSWVIDVLEKDVKNNFFDSESKSFLSTYNGFCLVHLRSSKNRKRNDFMQSPNHLAIESTKEKKQRIILDLKKTQNDSNATILKLYKYINDSPEMIYSISKWICLGFSSNEKQKWNILFHLFLNQLGGKEIIYNGLTNNITLCKELLYGTFYSKKQQKE
jgi:hypothetical protein